MRAGEACVLDHCVLEELVEGRSYADSAPGELCILGGLAGGLIGLAGGAPSGKEDMRAHCRRGTPARAG